MPSAKAKAGAVGFALLIVFSLIGAAVAYEQVPEGHAGVQKDWVQSTVTFLTLVQTG